MSSSSHVPNCFQQPAEDHGHPGGISRVVLGPDAERDDRPEALNTERLIIHTNEYEPGGHAGDGHTHANQEQAVYILEGMMEATVGEEVVQAGFPCNVWHKHRNIGNGVLKFLIFSATLD